MGMARTAFLWLLLVRRWVDAALPSVESIVEALDEGSVLYHTLKYAIDDRDTAFLRELVRQVIDVKGMDSRRVLGLCIANEFKMNRYSVLHYASMHNGDLEDKVKTLLELGAPVDLATPDDILPMHVAAAHGNAKVVQVLLEAGADPRPTTNVGLTAPTLAARGGHLNVLKAFHRWGKVASAALLRRDFTTSRWTPLQYAVHSSNTDMVAFLVSEVGWGEAPLKEVLQIVQRNVDDGRASESHIKQLKEIYNNITKTSTTIESPASSGSVWDTLRDDIEHILQFRKNAAALLAAVSFAVGLFIPRVQKSD
mmetsp:Transcript_45047/g.97831  ORF Transcript_45047/g.97831 Transcript_45047/m.97831 type:complete len:310 (-) Transcript_45047:178-1107(-)